MTLSAALHATVGTLRRRPADLLPVYMLGAAVPAIARVVVVAGFAVAYGYLELTGRLAAVRSAVAGRNLNPPDPNAHPEAFAHWVQSVAPLVRPLFSPVVLLVLGVSLVLGLLAWLVLAAAVAAGQYAACDARLRDERGLTAAVAGSRRHVWSFLGAYLLEGVVWALATVVALGLVGVGLLVSRIAGLLLVPVALLLWLVVVVVARAVFVFVPPAIVVDDVGVVGALRASAGYVRSTPVGAVGYYLLALGVLVVFALVAGALSAVQAQSVVAPLGVLAVSPALDLIKTGLYDDHRDALAPPDSPVASLRTQFVGGLRRGLREVARFVREHPGLHVLAVVVGLVGVAMGWVAAGPLVGSLSTSIVHRLADSVPPVATLTFFGNNWTVAFATAYSGLALGVPAALSLWFNGFLLAVYARLEVAPLTLAAFVVPHSLFELPSLVVAGALGLHLGAVAWRTWRGRADRVALADAMERAFWVLVGLAVLLAVAAVLEGFVSPYYWRPFL